MSYDYDEEMDQRTAKYAMICGTIRRKLSTIKLQGNKCNFIRSQHYRS